MSPHESQEQMGRVAPFVLVYLCPGRTEQKAKSAWTHTVN